MFRTTLVAALKAASEFDVDGIEAEVMDYPEVSEVRVIEQDEGGYIWTFPEQEIVVLDDGLAEVTAKPVGAFLAQKHFLSFRVSGPLTQAHMPDGESGKVIEGIDTDPDAPPWKEDETVLPVGVKY